MYDIWQQLANHVNSVTLTTTNRFFQSMFARKMQCYYISILVLAMCNFSLFISSHYCDQHKNFVFDSLNLKKYFPLQPTIAIVWQNWGIRVELAEKAYQLVTLATLLVSWAEIVTKKSRESPHDGEAINISSVSSCMQFVAYSVTNLIAKSHIRLWHSSMHVNKRIPLFVA